VADIDTVRRLALALPEAEEGTSYGTPAWRVRGKLFARLHQDRETLVVRVPPEEREALLASEPDRFELRPHYVPYPEWVLVRLAAIDAEELREVLTDAWRLRAPTRLAAEHDRP
jgi:hypothetical protein